MKIIRVFAIPVAALLLLAGCATGAKEPSYTASIIYDRGWARTEMVEFAAGDIAQSIASENGLLADDAMYSIEFAGINSELGEQGYRISVSSDGVISIEGGDARGLMYGGLEVAEQIRLYGIADVSETEGRPFIADRGIKFDLPLDMRTPSYGDTGDSAQLNIETVWDMAFWKQEIDALARMRYNALTLWNLNPFASMVKVDKYPDVALEDVWRTTLPFDNSYNGTGSDLVREEHWLEENHEILLKMTIDEKIGFWREVMAYAKSRGIDVYVVTWNIYTFGENGKYGITSDVNSEVTKDYYRESVKAMIDTYPDLAGIGFTVGENMIWDPGMEIVNEKWLYDTYGERAMEALADEPDREFRILHRLHLAEFDLVQEIWKDFTGTLEYCDNYAAAHMLSMTDPTLSDDVLAAMPEGEKIWMTLRSDDIYSFTWLDTDFVREYMANLPDSSQLAGYMVGGDGVVPARDYFAGDEDFQGQLLLKKHYLFNLAWGRLGYDPGLSDDYFRALLSSLYPGLPTDLLFDAMKSAAKVIPTVSKQYFQRGDATWFPEASWSNPSTFGYLDVKRWMKSLDSMKDSDVLSIADYCEQYLAGTVDESMTSPVQTSGMLRESSEQALSSVSSIKKLIRSSRKADISEKEFLRLVADQEAMAYLGLYYSEKVMAAVNLRLFNDTNNESYRSLSLENLEKSLEYWKNYAAVATSCNKPQRYGRQGYVDLDEITDRIVDEIESVKKYKAKPIGKGITI